MEDRFHLRKGDRVLTRYTITVGTKCIVIPTYTAGTVEFVIDGKFVVDSTDEVGELATCRVGVSYDPPYENSNGLYPMGGLRKIKSAEHRPAIDTILWEVKA
jgi:hypothetical protein